MTVPGFIDGHYDDHSSGNLVVWVDAATEQVEAAERHYPSGGEKVNLNAEGVAGVQAAIEAYKQTPTA